MGPCSCSVCPFETREFVGSVVRAYPDTHHVGWLSRCASPIRHGWVLRLDLRVFVAQILVRLPLSVAPLPQVLVRMIGRFTPEKGGADETALCGCM